MKKLYSFRHPILSDEQKILTYARSSIINNLKTLNNGNGKIIEVRILGTSKGVISGYFDSIEKLCDEILPYNGKHNIFFTINSCSEKLTANMNELNPHVKNTTKDADIINRDWLLLDIDPKRPSNTSSTDEEHALALSKAIEIEDFLTANGFSAPILADSGNGIHLLYAINMENDNKSTELIKSFLNSLDKRFSDDKVDIDKSVYNAARICKLYGTMAVKGGNTAERPHRQSKFMEVPQNLETISAEQLQKIISLLTPIDEQKETPVKSNSKNANGSMNKLDVQKFIDENRLDVVSVKEENNGKLWRIACPFREHEDKAAFIQQFHNGAISAGCHHDNCNWTWQELRAKFDPKYVRTQELLKEVREAQPPEQLVPYNELLRSKNPNMYIDSAGKIMILVTANSNSYLAELSNFVPIPLELVYNIDGIDEDIKQLSIKIGGYLEGAKRLTPITISKENLFNSKWVIDLDFKAKINSDIKNGSDKLREIVQLFSDKAVKKSVYNHLGFRTIDNMLCYLHAGGAIGLENVYVNLSQNNLSGYALENINDISAEEKIMCINHSLKIFKVHKYGNVLFAYTFLAPLCDMFSKINNMPSFSLWLYGKSGSQKTTIAALLLDFFGKDFSKTNLPLSFNDTENSLMKKLALCKDSLTVIDDVIHPTANHHDIRKQKKLSQDMIFNIANRTGRGRMRADESLRKTLTPKGMVTFTAEYPFDNISESTTARLLSLEFEKDSVNLDILTDCQNNTISLNKTMGIYIEWLILNIDRLTAELQQRFEKLRSDLTVEFGENINKKLIEVCAFMFISLEYILQYFVEIGAIDNEYKDNASRQIKSDLQVLINKQSVSIVSSSPAQQFLDVLGTLFSDKTIYTDDVKGGTLLLWDFKGKTRVGWHDSTNYYFSVGENSGSIYVAVKHYYRQHDIDFNILPKELYWQLANEGIVTETDKGRPTKVKKIEGKSQRVLIIPRTIIEKISDIDEKDLIESHNISFDPDESDDCE